MKEFDEEEAVRLMCAAATIAPGSNAAYEVLDLIYDFYDDNDCLDVDSADNAPDDDIAAIAAYVQAQLAKKPAEEPLTPAQIAAMVEAEVNYEDSLI